MKPPRPGRGTAVWALAPRSEEREGERAPSAASPQCPSMHPRGLTGLLVPHPKSQKLIRPCTGGQGKKPSRSLVWRCLVGLTAGTPLSGPAASVARGSATPSPLSAKLGSAWGLQPVQPSAGDKRPRYPSTEVY